MPKRFEKPIVILGPMHSETELLLSALSSPTVRGIGGYTFHEGLIDDYPVVVCRCCIGVVNSAAAAALAVGHYSPLCVIIQGTSGAHNPTLHQGDIVLGERLVHIGRFFTPHRDPGSGTDAFAWEFQGSEISSLDPVGEILYLHSDSRIIEAASGVGYTHGKVIRGTIGAADIWNRELDMIAHLHKTLGTDCEEMEGFGVAQVCAQAAVPCADIRVISNSEWYPDEEFDQKYGELSQMFVLDTVASLIADASLL